VCDSAAVGTVIRVLLVDDQPLVLAGLSRILGPEPDIEIVGECTDGSQVLDAVDRLDPDVVLMDIRMKQVGGAEATRLLAARPGAPPVLVLTTFDDDEVVAAALSAGAAGFVLKDAPGEDLIRATTEVAAGNGWLDPALIRRIVSHYRTAVLPRAEASARLTDLTERERDVLSLVARGATNQEVAATLHISEATVKSHIGHIFTKLDLRDRPAAIVFAYDHGLVSPGS
jgi:DNA-binding NarL/FixJ family response regulator